MAVYYFAAHYRSRTGNWPEGPGAFPPALLGNGPPIMYHRTDTGYEASLAPPEGSLAGGGRLVIDHLGHLQHRE